MTIISATMLIVVIFGILVHTVFLDSYRELELRETRTEINNVLAALNGDIENLSMMVSDWAIWDDTYYFVQDKNQHYIDANLVNSTFDGLGINVLLLLDTNGNMVYQKAYDLESHNVIPIPEELKLYLDGHPNLLHLDGDQPVNGYISIDGKPTMLSISPILTSNGYGPSRGTMVFGKFIQGNLLERITRATNGDLSILPYSPDVIPAGSQFEALDGNANQYFYYQAASTEEMNVYAILRDFSGESAFILALDKDRAIYQQGLAGMVNQFLAIILTSLTAGGMILAILDRSFLSRLGSLIQTVGTFRSKPQENLSTVLPGNDELSILSREIDQTLHHLLHAQKQLYQNLEYENFMIDISTRLINLPISQINQAIQVVLETIGKQIGAEGGHIFFFERVEHQTPSELYEWVQDKRYSVKHKVDLDVIESFTWGRQKLWDKATIKFIDYQNLPEGAVEEKAFCQANHIQSAISIPLKFSNELSGMIAFETFTHPKKWESQTIKILEIIANIIANAIDRRQKEKQLQLNQQYQFRLNRITKTSIAKDTCSASMRALSRQLPTLIGSERGLLILIRDSKTYDVYENGKKFRGSPELKNVLQFLRSKSQKDILVYDNNSSGEYQEKPELGWLGESIIAIPMKAKNQYLGWIILADSEERVYKEQEIAVCQQAATQITLSIIKILSLEESQEVSRELRSLRTIIADISSELDLKQLQSKILERATKLIRGEGGIYYVYDEAQQELICANAINMESSFSPEPIQVGEGAGGKAIQLKRTLFIKDYSTWKFRLPGDCFSHIRSSIVTPLLIGDRILGSIFIFRTDAKQNFTKNDQRLLDIYAQHASIAIENAMLFEKTQEMARQDEVTGLLNRRALNEIGDYELSRSARLGRPIAVAMVDLDNYKEINDKHNHLVGDKVLREVSRLLRENVRNIDIIGRYGGDESVIIMPETDMENAINVTERIRSILEEEAIEVDGIQFHLTACFGISVYNDNPPSLEKMIDEADTAMYAAKEGGRNAIRVFQNL
ncbi:MAG: hypothetical protein PWQ55_78 [Chloroflexota bacterium]|nr:hypothetical protein [Chloroflexota bacterium]